MAASYFGDNFGQGPSTLATPPFPPHLGDRHLATISPSHPGASHANAGDCKGGGGYLKMISATRRSFLSHMLGSRSTPFRPAPGRPRPSRRPPPPLPESGRKVGWSRRMARCYAPPVGPAGLDAGEGGGGASRRPWMAKLDIHSSFWSIFLPCTWHGIFVLQTR